MDRTLVIALALVTLPLAGCIAEEPTGTGLTPTNATDEDTPLTTPDGRGEFAAFKETNRTEEGLGGVEHAHDYWLGRDRVVIGEIESGLIPFPLTPADGNGKQYTPGTAIADFQPPQPNLVYEGTATLEVVMNRVSLLTPGAVRDSAPDHPAANFNFQYLTAKDSPGEWREGGPLPVGQPVIIQVAPDEVDMPHATGSLWAFRFYTDEPTAVVFNATITVVRGEEVEEWPGHPDFYADKTHRVVLDKDAQTKAYGIAKYLVTGEDTSWNHPEKLISYGTRELHVFVNFTKIEGLQQPTKFYLDFHNATIVPGIGDFDPAQTRIYDEGTDGKSYHFVIGPEHVNDGGMDSPYQTMSRWGFRVLGELEDAAGNPNCLGLASSCLEYIVDYHMTIIAVGESTALGVEGAAMTE